MIRNPMHRQVLLLATAQALFQTAVTGFFETHPSPRILSPFSYTCSCLRLGQRCLGLTSMGLRRDRSEHE